MSGIKERHDHTYNNNLQRHKSHTTCTAQQCTIQCHWKSKITLAKTISEHTITAANQTLYLLVITNHRQLCIYLHKIYVTSTVIELLQQMQ